MLENIINKLKESPLFNLSLGSKELFHSNFLYWLGNKYPNEFGKIFKKFLKIETDDNEAKDFQREKSNIDLSFKYKDGQQILIENKVKSIPYIEQLQKYSKKHASDTNNNFILLSLSKPEFINSDNIWNESTKWHYLSYKELSSKLQSMSELISYEYHNQIVKDYCEFIDNLVKINNKIKLDSDGYFDFHSKENRFYKELQKIRLHDFYLKRIYELFTFHIYEKVKKMIKRSNVELIGFGLPIKELWGNDNESIFISHGMTRGQGLFDLKYKVSDHLLLGIQIQGDHYRMVVEDNNSQIAKKIKEELVKLGWFDFSESFPNQDIYPKGEKDFNKFGDNFFYKSVKLDPNLKIDKVSEIILNDIQKIMIINKEISNFEN